MQYDHFSLKFYQDELACGKTILRSDLITISCYCIDHTIAFILVIMELWRLSLTVHPSIPSEVKVTLRTPLHLYTFLMNTWNANAGQIEAR